MSKQTRVVHNPGEQPPPADPATQTGDDQAQQESGDDEMARLRAEVAALKADKEARAECDALIAAADTAAMSEKLTSNKPGDLRAIDVDPSKIKRAVLTRDGWVCPVESPTRNSER